jgi:hypothetical protein
MMDQSNHSHHHHHRSNSKPSINRVALSATLHCLTGCAIGEVAGLVIGTAFGLSDLLTIILAITLAFVFGFALSALPLLRAGLAIPAALSLVVVADSLSITVMEIADNTVMVLIPGAMDAGLGNPLFWLSLTFALGVAFVAAYPVNIYLLKRNKGHALTMKYHGKHH